MQLKPIEIGLQVPCDLHSKMPEEESARGTAQELERGVPLSGGAEGDPDRGEVPDAEIHALNHRHHARTK